MVGRNVENANVIRAYINTRSLISIGSTTIYGVDICTVYGSSLMSFSTVCRWVKFQYTVRRVVVV